MRERSQRPSAGFSLCTCLILVMGLGLIACDQTGGPTSPEASPAAFARVSTGGFSAAARGGTEKVDICHIPPGNPGNRHVITVSESAVPAHLAHGDNLGDCEGPVVF